MATNIMYKIIAKDIFNRRKEIIQQCIMKWIFYDEEDIVNGLIEMLENDHECDIDKNDSKTKKEIAKELLTLYRKSIQPDLSREQVSITDWGREYNKLLLVHTQKEAEEIVLEKIRRESGVDVIHAKQILDKSISKNEELKKD